MQFQTAKQTKEIPQNPNHLTLHKFLPYFRHGIFALFFSLLYIIYLILVFFGVQVTLDLMLQTNFDFQFVSLCPLVICLWHALHTALIHAGEQCAKSSRAMPSLEHTAQQCL